MAEATLQHPHEVRRLRPLLGTFVEISAAGDPALVQAAVDAAVATIGRVQALMSFHDEHSDVSRINRAPRGVRVKVSEATSQVLRFGEALRRLSDGAFDLGVGGVLVAQGALPLSRPVSGDARHGRRARAADLELLDDGAVRWRRCGLIDLGGIAKGYAVDCAVDALRREGATHGLVNAGGDLRCYGAAQPVYVRAPAGQLVKLGALSDGALATSGDSPRAAGGALVDPGSEAVVPWQASISVLADDCMTADALTKIVRLCPVLAADLLSRFAAQAFRVEGDGRVRMMAAPALAPGRLQ